MVWPRESAQAAAKVCSLCVVPVEEICAVFVGRPIIRYSRVNLLQKVGAVCVLEAQV